MGLKDQAVVYCPASDPVSGPARALVKSNPDLKEMFRCHPTKGTETHPTGTIGVDDALDVHLIGFWNPALKLRPQKRREKKEKEERGEVYEEEEEVSHHNPDDDTEDPPED